MSPPPEVLCPICQTENPAGTRFCANCGNLLESKLRGAVAPQVGFFRRHPLSRLFGLGPSQSALLIVLFSVLILGGAFWAFQKFHTPAGSGAWFRLHGSTTIGLLLAPRLAEGFLHSKGATGIATTAVQGAGIHFRVEGTLPSERTPRVIEIQALGSGSGFTDLAGEASEIAMSSREIKPSEISALSRFGDFSGRSSDRIIGLDGVAVIVNRDNPLTAINLDELARIFSGANRNWSEMSGAGSGEILVAARDDKSGTWETFRDLVLEPRGMRLGASTRFEDNAKLAAFVSGNLTAIGFVGMTYAKNVKTLKVGHPGLRALLPTRLTVLHEEYPLRRRLHLFVPSRAVKDAAALNAAREFTEFAVSHEGQVVVDESGFVSEDTSQAMGETTAEELPARYPAVMRGAKLLYTLFFQSGSASLEPLALDNVDRLTELMTRPQYKTSTVFLVGHADNTGGHRLNLEVSEKRVNTVRDKLNDRGVPVALALPFGEEFPIEPNLPGKGNPRNRRVEVWIKRK